MARKRRGLFGFWFRLAFWTLALAATWLAATTFIENELPAPVQFSLKQGSGLRSVARQLQNAGVVDFWLRFELLARAWGLEIGRAHV